MKIDLITELEETPWKLFQRDCNDVDELLRDVTMRLGVPIVFSKLRPHEESDSSANSLSSRYGLGKFPLHTDFSTYPRPPRFILLLARKPRKTQTIICNTKKIANEFKLSELQSSVFIIQKTFPHYCRMIEGQAPYDFYRFNSDVMVPKNECAQRISNFIVNDLISEASIDWTENCGALVFNWKALHGRGIAKASEGEQLERYAFY